MLCGRVGLWGGVEWGGGEGGGHGAPPVAYAILAGFMAVLSSGGEGGYAMGVTPRHDRLQVVSPFIPAEENGAADDLALQRASISKRHHAWLQVRSGVRDTGRGWRPKAMHRLSARKWIENCDGHFRTNTHWGGLVPLKPDFSSHQWSDSNWRNWQHASFAQDQGADCRSGAFALSGKPEASLMHEFGPTVATSRW